MKRRCLFLYHTNIHHFNIHKKYSFLYSVFITYVIPEQTGKTFPLNNTSLCYLHYDCIVYLPPPFHFLPFWLVHCHTFYTTRKVYVSLISR